MEIWGITEGRRGHDVKIEGLAQALGGNLRMIHTCLPAPARWLAPYAAAMRQAARDPQIAPPFPDLVLASGRQAVPHARHIRKVANGKTFVAFLAHPHIGTRHFDFIWAPKHDRLTGRNVISTLTGPHNLVPQKLAEAAAARRPHLLPKDFRGEVVVVLIGGPNSAFHFTQKQMTELSQKLATIATPDRFLLVTMSRRSPPTYADILRAALPKDRYYLWDNEGDNPYQAMLGLADYVVVTADSVNMIGEACVIGKPVYLFRLPGQAGKFGRFHQAMIDEGLLHPFDGRLESAPPNFSGEAVNATPKIAAAIADAMQKKQRAS